MTSSPVKRVVLHAEVVPREVPCRIAQVVELVPEHPLGARWGRHNGSLHREADGGEQRLTRRRGLEGGRGGRRQIIHFILYFLTHFLHDIKHLHVYQPIPIRNHTSHCVVID